MKETKHTHIFPLRMTMAHVKIVAKNQKDAEKKAKIWLKQRGCMWSVDGTRPLMDLSIGEVTEIK